MLLFMCEWLGWDMFPARFSYYLLTDVFGRSGTNQQFRKTKSFESSFSQKNKRQNDVTHTRSLHTDRPKPTDALGTSRHISAPGLRCRGSLSVLERKEAMRGGMKPCKAHPHRPAACAQTRPRPRCPWHKPWRRPWTDCRRERVGSLFGGDRHGKFGQSNDKGIDMKVILFRWGKAKRKPV